MNTNLISKICSEMNTNLIYTGIIKDALSSLFAPIIMTDKKLF